MDDLSQAEAWQQTGDDRVRFAAVRDRTEDLVRHLTPEDQGVQSMPDASPAKWHRAHTTWFFEQFILLASMRGYGAFDEMFGFLFNSYYEAVGARHPRPMRGLLTRPSADQVTAYRAHVDAAMDRFLGGVLSSAEAALVELGLNHEQQHQELLVTDMLHAFAQNPLRPGMTERDFSPPIEPGPTRFVPIAGGIHRMGHNGPGFCFDNETPAHDVLLRDFALASRLVRNAEYQAFMADGGYRSPHLWMSDGWATVQGQGWTAPLHWFEREGDWWQMEPTGPRKLDPDAPVRHVSWYEADAFARWAGARLPSEAEWEIAVRDPSICEVHTHVWQWTDSAYRPYPGFQPVAGAVGEYNGKFMVNQMVLRGGSIATPAGHTRPSYRNFFHPDRRWQFSGLRLARNA